MATAPDASAQSFLNKVKRVASKTAQEAVQKAKQDAVNKAKQEVEQKTELDLDAEQMGVEVPAAVTYYRGACSVF